eukprot:1161033-Pelagomonas_calceolata.AAC.5
MALTKAHAHAPWPPTSASATLACSALASASCTSSQARCSSRAGRLCAAVACSKLLGRQAHRLIIEIDAAHEQQHSVQQWPALTSRNTLCSSGRQQIVGGTASP